MDEYEISIHESPSRPKWDEKTIQAAGDLVGNVLDRMKTRSRFHNASYASEIYIADHCYMMTGSDPESYQESCHDPRWK